MRRQLYAGLLLAGLFAAGSALGQDTAPAAQITLGNGEQNMIVMEGLSASEAPATFASVRMDGDTLSSFRANTTALTFSSVTIEKAGWLVLHPVIDGRPDGDMVSGFTYLEPGTTEHATIMIDHPADAGDKFLVMMHSDVDEDRVFDFVFVEDGINVEDKAVFEGTRMVAHIFAIPD